MHLIWGQNTINILGIASYWTSQGASILVDGKIICAVEEERFNRIKQGRRNNLPISLTDLPLDSIEECLNEAKLTIDDIDYVTYGYVPIDRAQNLDI